MYVYVYGAHAHAQTSERGEPSSTSHDRCRLQLQMAQAARTQSEACCHIGVMYRCTDATHCWRLRSGPDVVALNTPTRHTSLLAQCSPFFLLPPPLSACRLLPLPSTSRTLRCRSPCPLVACVLPGLSSSVLPCRSAVCRAAYHSRCPCLVRRQWYHSTTPAAAAAVAAAVAATTTADPSSLI